MNMHCCLKPVVLEKLQAGLLTPHLEALSRELSERGYATATSNGALRLFAALGTWIEQSALTLLDLNEAVLASFLAERYRHHQPRRHDRAMLAFVLAYLRGTGVLVPPPPVKTAVTWADEPRQELVRTRSIAGRCSKGPRTSAPCE